MINGCTGNKIVVVHEMMGSKACQKQVPDLLHLTFQTGQNIFFKCGDCNTFACIV